MLNLVSGPSIEPVSLDEAKAWLRVTHDDENSLIEDLIAAARARVEHATGLALITQQFEEILDGWPSHRLSGFGRAFALARGPVQNVETVSILNRDGGVTLWDSNEYRFEPGVSGRLVAVYPHTLPRPEVPVAGVELSFTAGYGGSVGDVPEPLREAVLNLVGDAYGNVEPAESAGRGREGLSERVYSLIAPYRRVTL